MADDFKIQPSSVQPNYVTSDSKTPSNPESFGIDDTPRVNQEPDEPTQVERVLGQDELATLEPTEIEHIEFIATNTLRVAADTEQSGNSDTPTVEKMKEVTIKRGGDIRVSFDLKSSQGGAEVNAQIYVNGVATGTLRSTTSNGYTTYTEDLTNVDADDEIQLYAVRITGSGTYDVRNFRIYWDKVTVGDFVIQQN